MILTSKAACLRPNRATMPRSAARKSLVVRMQVPTRLPRRLPERLRTRTLSWPSTVRLTRAFARRRRFRRMWAHFILALPSALPPVGRLTVLQSRTFVVNVPSRQCQALLAALRLVVDLCPCVVASKVPAAASSIEVPRGVVQPNLTSCRATFTLQPSASCPSTESTRPTLDTPVCPWAAPRCPTCSSRSS